MKDKEKYNEYLRIYMLERYRKRRADAIEKLGGKCVKCGSREELQFDHIDPSTKLFDLGKQSSCSQAKFDIELAKCQLLCEECHKSKTLVDKNQVSAKGTHGTLSSYRYCHCELCRKAKRDWTKEYRKTHPRKSRKKSALVA